MTTPEMEKRVAEQIAYERIIQAICTWRPDLQPGEVKARIQHLAETYEQTPYQWAESCQVRACQGMPMPWETDGVTRHANNP